MKVTCLKLKLTLNHLVGILSNQYSYRETPLIGSFCLGLKDNNFVSNMQGIRRFKNDTDQRMLHHEFN